MFPPSDHIPSKKQRRKAKTLADPWYKPPQKLSQVKEPLQLASTRTPTRLTKMLLSDPHCRYCNRILNTIDATIDHKIPRSRGGTNQIENLCLCCKQCNKEKGSMLVTEFLRKKGLIENGP